MSAIAQKFELKRVSYDGFNPPWTKSEIAYIIVENRILFSATENCVYKATSTINAAEEIIRRICEAEGISWNDYVFYDVQTSVGYPHHGPSYICVDELIIKELKDGDPHVEGWHNIGRTRNPRGQGFESRGQALSFSLLEQFLPMAT